MNYDCKPKKVLDVSNWGIFCDSDWINIKEPFVCSVLKLVTWAVNYVIDEMHISFDMQKRTVSLGCFDDAHFVTIPIPAELTTDQLDDPDFDMDYSTDLHPYIEKQNESAVSLTEIV